MDPNISDNSIMARDLEKANRSGKTSQSMRDTLITTRQMVEVD